MVELPGTFFPQQRSESREIEESESKQRPLWDHLASLLPDIRCLSHLRQGELSERRSHTETKIMASEVEDKHQQFKDTVLAEDLASAPRQHPLCDSQPSVASSRESSASF